MFLQAQAETSRLSIARDSFLGAENSAHLGGCRSHPGFPSSLNTFQGWGQFGQCSLASAWMLSTPMASNVGPEHVATQLMRSGFKKHL